MSRRLLRSVSTVLVVAHLGVITLPTATAGLVGADTTLEARTSAGDETRARLGAALARDEVREHLLRHGVTEAMAAERIAALSDEEAAKLAQDFDDLPAGASFSGLLLILFFGWALMNATDWGRDLFKEEEQPAATQ